MFNEIMDLVKIENGQPVTTSLIIAEVCNKNHNNVLAKIRKEITKVGRLKINRSSQQAFVESTYVSQQNKAMPMYILNRDGAMGIIFQYGDDISTEIRWRFIEAFNKMESQLKYGSNKTPQTYLEALDYERLCA